MAENIGGPIPLNEAQQRTAKEWAADDRMWTTQETVEQNLRTFARMILRDAEAAAPRPEKWDTEFYYGTGKEERSYEAAAPRPVAALEAQADMASRVFTKTPHPGMADAEPDYFPPPAEAREENIETLQYQAEVAAEQRPCGSRPCDREYPAMPSRWCSGCLIAALLEWLEPRTEKQR